MGEGGQDWVVSYTVEWSKPRVWATLRRDLTTMPKSDKPAGGVVAVRSRSGTFFAPGILGWSNLIDPDDAFDSLKFTLNTHHNEQQVEMLGHQVDAAVSALWDEFLGACEKAKKPSDKFKQPSGAEWVSDHLKDPGENSRIQLPYIKWANDAEFRDRKTQAMTRKTMRAYAPDGSLLDLPKLHLGRGSIVQPLLVGGIYISPLIRQPAPSFKLQGLRVVKLEQFGGQSGSVGAVSQDELAGLGESFRPDDLSAFASSMSGDDKVESRKPSSSMAPDMGYEEDLDDEIPF